MFKHKYLTQPAVTAVDAIVLVSEDLSQVLTGLWPVKGETRTAVKLLMEIFNNVEIEEETETDAQRTKMSKEAYEGEKIR